MSKFKFVNIVDTIFITLATLLIIFAWVQFFIKNIILSLILASIISLCIIFLMRRIKSKKQARHLNNIAQTTEMLKFKLTIQTLPYPKLISLIKQLIPSKYEPKTIKGDIVATKDGVAHIFTTHLNGELTEFSLLEILRTKPYSDITIFCISANNDTKAICSAFKNKRITLINLEQLYNLFNQNNITIDTSNIDLTKHKISLREIFKNAVSRNKSKGYFISGLVLLFTSLIIPYKVYYIVFSSALFALSLICRIKPSSVSATNNLID